jgi:16S rRNA pseudouridine516 synthase
MIAAAGNRCEALHRERIGGLALPDTLAPGAWQWLDETDLGSLRSG